MNPRSATLRLYPTRGPRRARHVLVLYFRSETDWPSRSMERGGNLAGSCLCSAPMTHGAETYCASRHRATSLQYSGKPPADAAGMEEDLLALGYDQPTIARFLTAAAPHWPPPTPQKVFAKVLPLPPPPSSKPPISPMKTENGARGGT